MNTHSAPLVDAQGLSRSYGAQNAVENVDLQARRGEVLGLLGLNGAGKSTTMRMLCGVLAPSSGSIRIDGIDLLEQPRRAKRAIGYLPEVPPLYPEMTVREYLHYTAALHGVERTRRNNTVSRALAECGLAEVEDRLIGQLSRGYRQRTGIAQAVLHRPPVLVLDEPTAGLDPLQIREIRDLIRGLGENHAVILSTHILAEVQSICSRVRIMHRGQLVHAEALDPEGDGRQLEQTFIDVVTRDHPGGATS